MIDIRVGAVRIRAGDRGLRTLENFTEEQRTHVLVEDEGELWYEIAEGAAIFEVGANRLFRRKLPICGFSRDLCWLIRTANHGGQAEVEMYESADQIMLTKLTDGTCSVEVSDGYGDRSATCGWRDLEASVSAFRAAVLGVLGSRSWLTAHPSVRRWMEM